jgi:hypothetical protein
MTKTERNNTIAILLVVLLWILLAAVALGLGGCAGQGMKLHVQTVGDESKVVDFQTDYQIENGFHMTRNVESGEYEINLGSATTKDTDAGLYQFMSQLLGMLAQAYGVPVPAQAAAPTPQQ